MHDVEALRRSFGETFARAPRTFWAPGRVNLIGEHTDYNDGFVLPVAVDMGCLVAAAPRTDRAVHVRSLNQADSATLSFSLDGAAGAQGWLAYVEGVARVLEERGHRLAHGADVVIWGDVPAGAGLSSSAALEVSVGLALATLAGVDVPLAELAAIGQRAEHQYVGTRCGIMDQTISALGKAGHALLLDCRSLETRHVPLETGALANAALLVVHSGVSHSLASSAYNTRRDECAAGAAVLGKSLRDATLEDVEQHKAKLGDVVYRRCRHVVSENARVVSAVSALGAGDVGAVGKLMAQSHASLRADYEVSCSELDLLVELAAQQAGVLGARMTGGGFGGCTVNLVERARVERVKSALEDAYERATGKRPRAWIVRAADGARELKGAH